jgi:hypothetical protein
MQLNVYMFLQEAPVETAVRGDNVRHRRPSYLYQTGVATVCHTSAANMLSCNGVELTS